MSTKTATQKTPTLARYAAVEASPVIQAYCDWIEQETGRRPDAWSVYVGSQLRGTFQKTPANQSRLAAEAKARAARDAEKAARKIEREAAAAAKAAEPTVAPAPKAPVKKVAPKATPTKAPARRRPAKGATVATVEGVVIAEQNHIEAQA